MIDEKIVPSAPSAPPTRYPNDLPGLSWTPHLLIFSLELIFILVMLILN